MAMQSSPVDITESRMSTPIHLDISIPSVLGLSPGAVKLSPEMLMFFEPVRPMWFRGLFKCWRLYILRPLQLLKCIA